MSRRAAVSWSGGKDSCLATILAVESGLSVEELLCVYEPDADRSRSHALPAWIIESQARQLGLPLRRPTASWADYERVFVETLAGARARGLTDVVFGDIDLRPHREWEERVCALAGVAARLPLWDWPRTRVVEEIFARGIDALCVCVNTRLLPREFCGRRYDRSFIEDLPTGVDACGENGEFHTCVTDAPLFREPVCLEAVGTHTYQAPAGFGGDLYVFADLARRASAPA